MSSSFDLRYLNGPFDVIGDLHGCVDELEELLAVLGYKIDSEDHLTHPENRTLVFLGDLNDRGPHNAEACRLAMLWVGQGSALYAPGNHCNKLKRYLEGRKVTLSQGLDVTVKEVERMERRVPGFAQAVRRFIEEAPPYLWLAGGRLVVAHGGIKDYMIGRADERIRSMVLFGDTTGEKNPDGTPVRLDWAAHYRGKSDVIYGHTPTSLPLWRNRTANIDQACVFGGWLTAARWPERDFVQVGARYAYYVERTPSFLVARVQVLQGAEKRHRPRVDK
jgi:hypothetical protein